jgi:SAM-dependent methyltransferase
MPRGGFALNNDLNVANARMDEFLARIGSHLDAHAPELRQLFDTMAEEARFARDWLSEDLARLPDANAALLEVGGGAFLLSCQLAAEGFVITAIEPTGVGFGEFRRLGEIVLELAAVRPTIAPCKAEDFISDERFDFAFSLNVMEHVDMPDEAIARVSEVLKPGASYRFLCPNYAFPYEPHFNIPTLFTKGMTLRLMRRRIDGTSRMDDPKGVWRSLNWITVPKVKRFAAKDATLTLHFNRATLVWMLERALTDKEFAGRRSRWMVTGVRTAAAMRLHRLAGAIPATLQPIMDVRMTKRL